jgi:hypothetical protein
LLFVNVVQLGDILAAGKEYIGKRKEKSRLTRGIFLFLNT